MWRDTKSQANYIMAVLERELGTGHDPDGSPTGPAPEMARRVAAAVDRTPVWVEYALPSDIVAAAHSDEWDICFIAADPARADVMDFTEPWTRLEVCFAASAAIEARTDVVIGVRQFLADLDLVVSDDTVTTIDQAIGVNLNVDDGLSLPVMSFIRAEA